MPTGAEPIARAPIAERRPHDEPGRNRSTNISNGGNIRGIPMDYPTDIIAPGQYEPLEKVGTMFGLYRYLGS
jgi:hypothetical protein